MYCCNCGNKLGEKEFFCGRCGSKNEIIESEKSPSKPANKSRKSALIISWVAVILLIGVGVVIHVLSRDSKEVTVLSAEDYLSLTFIEELDFDSGRLISISPDGRYVVTHDHDLEEIYIYENEGEGFWFLKSFTDAPDVLLRDDGSIAWSHCGERFVISFADGFMHLRSSNIHMYDIYSGTIEKLTGERWEGVSSPIDLSGDEDWHIDTFPVWADDDTGIYFARYAMLGGSIIATLCYVSLETREVDTVVYFCNREDLHHIFPTMIYRDGTIFYDLISPSRLSRRNGIYQYVNGEEKLLIRSDWESEIFVQLIDVSSDGTKILYVNAYNEMNRHESNQFFLKDISDPEQVQELLPISTDAVIRNVMFSPDGGTIMQIESNILEEWPTHIYIRDASDITRTQNLVYTSDDFLLSATSFGGARWAGPGVQLLPRWLGNGYFVTNSDMGNRLYRINSR